MKIPKLLKPAYSAWMKFASILAWINTRIILFLIFYLVFTPIGLLMRLFRAGLLDIRVEKDRQSYWKKKEKPAFNPSDYERQF